MAYLWNLSHHFLLVIAFLHRSPFFSFPLNSLLYWYLIPSLLHLRVGRFSSPSFGTHPASLAFSQHHKPTVHREKTKRLWADLLIFRIGFWFGIRFLRSDQIGFVEMGFSPTFLCLPFSTFLMLSLDFTLNVTAPTVKFKEYRCLNFQISWLCFIHLFA